MEYGIIFENEVSPFAEELSLRLSELGLYRGTADSLTPELLEALNDYREANKLIVLDFCDPAVLRTLGIKCQGDEIIALARYAESVTITEIECCDLCREIVGESRQLNISIAQVIERRENAVTSAKVSSSAVMCALLAVIQQ